MVLDIGDGKPVSKVPRYHDFVNQHRQILSERAEAFHARQELVILKNTPKVLYLFQREYAVLNLEDKSIPTIVGSDEATTCHLVVLLSRRKRILSFAHIDGHGISNFISSSLRLMRDSGDDLSEGIDTYIVGGFNDDRGESYQLSTVLLDKLAKSKATFSLRVAAITEFNSELRPNINLQFPRRYGLAVNTETTRTSDELDVIPAVFEEYGPCPALRSTRFCCQKQEMVNVYNIVKNEIELAPFEYSRLRELELLVTAPDHVLRRYSTSPAQEKSGYEQRMRNTLRFMLENPKPKDIFKNSPLRFQLLPESGLWGPVE